jgi:hypothetical protein
MPYLIASIKHTRKKDKLITFWQSNSAGYCFTYEQAGKYSGIEVYDKLHYFSNHVATVAILLDEIEGLFIDLPEGHLEGSGKIMENTKANWKFIYENGVESP